MEGRAPFTMVTSAVAGGGWMMLSSEFLLSSNNSPLHERIIESTRNRNRDGCFFSPLPPPQFLIPVSPFSRGKETTSLVDESSRKPVYFGDEIKLE